MDVHRVWKGEVAQAGDYLLPCGASGGSPPSTPRATTWLKPGERFVVFTTNATFEGRPKLAQDRAFWVAPCYGLIATRHGCDQAARTVRKPKETN